MTPHSLAVLLAADGQGHNTNGQGLHVLPVRQDSQSHPPSTSRDTGTPLPFRPHPRRPGRTAAAIPRPHLPVHDNRQDIKVAGGNTPLVHHRRLGQGPLRRLGSQIWSACHHHIRQRGPVHVRLVGDPMQFDQHPTCPYDSLPPSIQRSGRAVPQAAEGRPVVSVRRC
jgi:hypothetical protein